MKVQKTEKAAGLYLQPEERAPFRRRRYIGRWITVMVLLAWDGLLLYMIVRCLIEPVYGACFVGAVSIYLGYQLK